MSDKELLEFAAKAAGITVKRSRLDDPMHSDFLIANSPRNTTSIYGAWNPLTDDGDALRLAVKLGLLVDCDDVLKEVEAIVVMRGHDDDYVRRSEKYGADPYAATRRAITRAAAAIGRGTP